MALESLAVSMAAHRRPPFVRESEKAASADKDAVLPLVTITI